MDSIKNDTKILRGIAICLMICCHLFSFPGKLTDVSFVSVPFLNNMSFASNMGLFGRISFSMLVLLCGFELYAVSKSCDNLTRLIFERLLRSYKKYWLVFIIAVPVSLLLGMEKPEHFVADLIYCFLGLRFSYCSEWWLITPLALLITALPVILRIADRKHAFFSMDVLSLLIFSELIYFVLPKLVKLQVFETLGESVLWNGVYTALTLYPAFAMGCLMAKYGVMEWLRDNMLDKGWWVAAASALLPVLFCLRPLSLGTCDYIYAALFCSGAIVLINTKPGKALGKVFGILGEEAEFMWLIHPLFCYYWCQKLIFAPKYAVLIFLLLTLLSFAAAKFLRLVCSSLGRLLNKSQ